MSRRFSFLAGQLRACRFARSPIALLLILFAPPLSRAQTVGAIFDVQPQNALYDQSNAVSVYNPDDNEIAVIYTREATVADSGDPFTARRDEVRATIYDAEDMSVLANDVLILQQNVPDDRVGCRPDHMQFDNLDLAYNAFSGEYVAAAGAQIDPDGNCPSMGAGPQDEGEFWVQRFAPTTGATVGAPFYFNNGPGGSSVEENVFGAEAGIACSTVNGNILVAYGRAINGVGDTVVAGMLLSPALAKLNVGTTGQDLGTVAGPPGFFFALHFLQSCNVTFDAGRGEFIVPWFNQYTTNGVAFTSPDLHIRTVNDTLSTSNSLEMGPNVKLVQSDLMGDPSTNYAGGEDHELINRGFSKPIRNPYSTSADTEFVIAYQWDKLGLVGPDPAGSGNIDTEYPYDALRMKFFGLNGSGGLIDGPVADVLSLAETATEVRFPRLVPLPEREQFAIVWIDDLVSQQGYANNAAWQAAPAEPPASFDPSFRDIKYIITNAEGARVPGFGPAAVTLRTGMEELPDKSGDSPFLAYVPPASGDGFLLASWEERTSAGEARHPRAVTVTLPAQQPLAVDAWAIYE